LSLDLSLDLAELQWAQYLIAYMSMPTSTTAFAKPAGPAGTAHSPQQAASQRAAERRAVSLPARLTWKDHGGATRFATVVTRNVSEFGVYVECPSVVSIPLYRLVQFQLERDVRESDRLPDVLRQGRILSAVYRVSPPTGSAPQGLALRLMVDPKRRVQDQDIRATA
jgi:hypothetical protein